MKYKVLKLYQDKETGKINIPGSFVKYDLKRAKELVKKGFLEKPRKPGE